MEFEWMKPEIIAALSRKPFGRELAEKVAHQIEKGMLLAYTHRDYCGDGLYFDKGRYIWASIHDGGPDEDLKTWTSREAFITFLAEMSDYTCCGAEGSPDFIQYSGQGFQLNNQKITRARLEDATKKLY